ncbi:hypothetical protein ACFUTR_23365 [Streptomyces sp. NPDC057367]|uniref:hypothetical protein n=1 Tax=Streptomyces sp. NPDC057367 TaxID=3346108 RepID=UPI00364227F3
MTFPEFRPDPDAHKGRCAVQVNGTRCYTCAAWHLDFGPDADGTRRLSSACDPHMELVQAESVYAARHPFGPACREAPWEVCAAESMWQAPDGDGQRTLAVSAESAATALDKLREQLAFGLHPDLQGPDEEPTT